MKNTAAAKACSKRERGAGVGDYKIQFRAIEGVDLL